MNNAVCKNNFLVAGADNWCHTRIRNPEYCSYVWTIDNYFEYCDIAGNLIESSWFKSKTNDKCIWSLRLSNYVENSLELRLNLNCNTTGCERIFVKYKMSIINAEEKPIQVHEPTSYFELFLEESYLDVTNIATEESIKKKLTILFDLQFFVGDDEKAVEHVFGESIILPKENVSDCDLHSDFERLLFSDDFSDLIIDVGDKKYPAHKNILAARSEVFAAMFKHNMKEQNQNHVNITDMDANVLEEMLRYIYTGKVPNVDQIDFDLLTTADKYDLKRLRTICEYSLMKKVSIDNAIDILVLADFHSATMLEEKTIQFVARNIESVKKTESWSNFERSDLLKKIIDALSP